MRHEREGVRLGYSDTGRGLAVVLVHGFANDRTLWREQVAVFRDRYRVIVPDLRGFGESAPTDGRPVSMDEYADDIAEVLAHLGIERAVVGGISLGGYVALAFALRHRDRLAGLVLANTRAGADDPAWAQFREAMVRGIEARGADAVVENYGDKPFRPDCDPGVRDRVRAMIRRQPVTGLVSGTRGMAQRPDRTAALATLEVPTLVIHGTEDRYVPAAEAEAMHAAIAGSTYVNLPGAGHFSCIDTPGPFNAALAMFLARVAAACPA